MREIFHKAKIKNGKEWIKGVYYEHCSNFKRFFEEKKKEDYMHYMIVDTPIEYGKAAKTECIEINSDTLCEYIGMVDCRKRHIFTNDIIAVFGNSVCGHETIEKYLVVWEDNSFRLARIMDNVIITKKTYPLSMITGEKKEIIDNLFDNPCLEFEKEKRNGLSIKSMTKAELQSQFKYFANDEAFEEALDAEVFIKISRDKYIPTVFNWNKATWKIDFIGTHKPATNQFFAMAHVVEVPLLYDGITRFSGTIYID